MKLYHGTSESVARLALVNGLRPRGRKRGNWKRMPSGKDRVYLTTAYALYFAANMTKEGERWAVLEIDTDKLIRTNLVPDEDFLEQGTRLSQKYVKGTMEERTKFFRDNIAMFSDNFELSVERLGTAAHMGPIPASAITRVAFFDPQSNPSVALRAMDPMISMINYQLVGASYRALVAWLFAPLDPQQEKEMMGIHDGMEVLPDFAKYLEESLKAVRMRDGVEVVTNARP